MPAPELPKQIHRYRVLSELGRGSMGRVYLAEDPNIERRIALKVLMPERLGRDDRKELRQRFLQEARAAGGLNHPGIVTVFDADTDPESGYPYLAMEWVQGLPLRTLLHREGPLAAARAVTMAGQVARALDYAHRRDVIHRDVKPANLLVTTDEAHPPGAPAAGAPAGTHVGGEAAEIVKVVDFGIAKLLSKSFTQPGRVLGSPYYMAPEQVRGIDVDGRTDLFALGAVLYECLTGRPAFGGETVANVNHKILSVDPRPIELYNPDVPASLRDVVRRALEKAPGDRFQSGAEMAAALESVGTEMALANDSAAETPAAPGAVASIAHRGTSVTGPPAPPVDPEADTIRGQVPGADGGRWLGVLALGAVVLVAGALVGRSIDPELLGGAIGEGSAAAPSSPVEDASPPEAVPAATVVPVADEGLPDTDGLPLVATDAGDGEASGPEPPILAIATPPADPPSSRAESVTPPPPPAATPPPPAASPPPPAAPPPPPVAPPPVGTTNLEIVHQNHIKLAYLSVWVDGRRALSAKLEARGVFKRRKGQEHSWLIPVPVGKRSIEVRISGLSKQVEAHRKTWRRFSTKDPQRLVVELPQGAERLNLSWQAR